MIETGKNVYKVTYCSQCYEKLVWSPQDQQTPQEFTENGYIKIACPNCGWHQNVQDNKIFYLDLTDTKNSSLMDSNKIIRKIQCPHCFYTIKWDSPQDEKDFKIKCPICNHSIDISNKSINLSCFFEEDDI